jgi:hypothetical protein
VDGREKTLVVKKEIKPFSSISKAKITNHEKRHALLEPQATTSLYTHARIDTQTENTHLKLLKIIISSSVTLHGCEAGRNSK